MASSKVDYVFTRDFLDNNRINLMHFYWTKDFGYLTHPKIPINGPLRVADVGTGSAIWLLDAQDQFSKETQLDGFDISFDAAPPPELLPSNVAFHKWNVKESIPEGFVGVFDIVHIRFFSFVLLDDEVAGVIAKLFDLLKPGGFIQWDEPDMETLYFKKSKPEGSTDKIVELYKLMGGQDTRFKPTWNKRIPELLQNGGFVDIEKEIREAAPHLAFQYHECGLMMHELIARKTQSEEMAQSLKRLLPAAVEETRNGSYAGSGRFSVIARKP